MVKKENKILNSDLYENMIKAEKNAYLSQDLLLKCSKDWFSDFINEEDSEFTKIVLSHEGSIELRTVCDLSEEIIMGFEEEFNFKCIWQKEESIVDFGNVEPVTAKVFTYAFLPKNIKELLGDNQVDLGE